MDKIVIDIETSNTFADVGKENLSALDVSLVGLYSYNQDSYFTFDANQLKDLIPIFEKTSLLIGFSIARFDIPVLSKYFDLDLYSIPRIDLLEEIEQALGKRIGLDLLSRINLGAGKTHHGLEAAHLYNSGKIEELKNYCLNDVKLTKNLYDLAVRQGYLLVPQKNSQEFIKASFNWQERLITTPRLF